MKVTLFGATGKSGRVVLDELLENNYKVSALVRSSKKVEKFRNKIEIVEGSIMSKEDIDKVLKNSEAVISTIGHVRDTKPDFQKKAIELIIERMKANQIKRLIVLTGAGVFAEGDHPKLIDKLMTKVLRIVSKNRIIDGENYVKEIMNSNLDWTVVRTPLQTNSAPHPFGVGKVGDQNLGYKISRKNIAEFIVKAINYDKYIRSLPYIAELK